MLALIAQVRLLRKHSISEVMIRPQGFTIPMACQLNTPTPQIWPKINFAVVAKPMRNMIAVHVSNDQQNLVRMNDIKLLADSIVAIQATTSRYASIAR